MRRTNACPSDRDFDFPMTESVHLSVTLLGLLFRFASPEAAVDSESILTAGAEPAIIAAENAQGQKGFYVVSTGRGLNLSYSPALANLRRGRNRRHSICRSALIPNAARAAIR